MRHVKFLGLIGLLFMLAACGGEAASNEPPMGRPLLVPSEEPLQVVATTTLVADLIAHLGGTRVNVEYLMGPGVDPHYYVATAGDLNRLENADLIVYHGLNLEERMSDIFSRMAGQGRALISTEPALDPSQILEELDYWDDEEDAEDEGVDYDPHIWFDVALWIQAASHFNEELARLFPGDAEYFQSNYEAYVQELSELHAYLSNRAEEISPEARVLITAHDAFQYFGEAYGFQVMGVQGISTTAEAGTADIAGLADFIVERGIGAIFVEASVSPRNIEALQEAVSARGHEVAIGGELFSDALGDAASGADTYISMMKANMETIVNALR